MKNVRIVWTAVVSAVASGLSLVFAFTEPRLSVPFGIFSVSMAILSTREEA